MRLDTAVHSDSTSVQKYLSCEISIVCDSVTVQIAPKNNTKDRLETNWRKKLKCVSKISNSSNSKATSDSIQMKEINVLSYSI